MSAFDNAFNSVYGLIDYSDFKSIYIELEKEEKEFRAFHFVVERIELVSRLHRANDLFFHAGELIIYLLLTCFDILGENKEWASFDEWLKSRKKKKERNDIFSKIDNNEELLQKVRGIHSEYKKIYGVKTSFNNFIDDVLSEEARIRLLDSIRKVKSTLKDGVVDIQYSNRAENKDLLFKLRNHYTHRGIGVPLSVISAKHSSFPCWSTYVGLFGINSDIELYDWPATLFYAVKKGFIAYIKQFSLKNDTSQNRKHFSLRVEDFIRSAFNAWEIEYLEDLTADRLLRQIAGAFNSQGSKREIRIAGYGFDWVIKDITTNRILTDLTIKRGDAAEPLLKEYDIFPDSILKVIDIQDKLNFSEKSLHVKRKLSNGSYLYATYQNKSLVEFGDEKDERFFGVKEFQEVIYE